MVFAVVLISELLAVVFALVRVSEGPFWPDLGRISLFVQWLGLTGAGLLCVARPRLVRLPVAGAALAVFVLLMLNTAVFSVLTVELGLSRAALGIEPQLPTSAASFLLRNEAICVIVTALLLRYFFVAHEWRRHVRTETRARIDALQARMRPHFLFNTMNTIAALTRSDPASAESAVEDLADLLRVTLQDSNRPVCFADELELTRTYARIEALRLGDRLRLCWDVAAVPAAAQLPSLTIQPLLENAIYHGIEPLPAGGEVAVHGQIDGGQLVITLSNPVDPEAEARPGNRHALDNLRERIALAYGERGSLETEHDGHRFRVRVKLPLEI
jgi:two-component system, LytTR family, sensor histidine kinase AlgZ